MSSALFQEIRERHGLAYSVYSSLSNFSDCGSFSVYAGTAPDQVRKTLKLIRGEMERVTQKSIPRVDMERVKENLKGTLLLSADSVESRMNSIAKNELMVGRYVTAEEVCQDIDRVTAADLRAIANKLLVPGLESVLVLGPERKPTWFGRSS